MAQDNLAISISFVEDAKHNITDLSKRFNALLKNTTLKVNVTGDALDELKKITKAVKTLNTTMGNVKLQAPVDTKKVKEASAGISALEKDVERLKTSFATAQAELEKLGNAKASRSNEISLLDKEIEKYDKLIASAKEYEKATYKSLRDVAQGQRDRYIQQGQNADAAITQKRNELLKITESLAQKEKELEAARSAGGKTSTAKERLELLKNIDKSITDISTKIDTLSSKGPVKIVDSKTAVDVAKLAEELKKVGDVTAGMQTTKGGADMHMLRRYVEFSNIIKTLVQQFSEFIPLLQNTNFSSLATSLTEASRAMSSLAVNVQNVGQNMAHNFSASLSGEINKITEEAVKAGRALDELGQKKESNAKYNFTKDFSVADALGKIEAYQRMLKEVNDLIKRTQSRGKDTSQLEDYKRRITEIIDALKRLRDSGGTVAQSIFSNMTTKQFMNSTASNAKELRELWKSYKDGLKLDKSSEDAKNQLNKLSKKFQDLIDLRDRLSKLNLDTSQAENALKGLKTLIGSLSAIQLNGKKNGMLYSDFMGQYSSKKAIANANDAMREGRRAVREREREEAAVDRQRMNSLSQIERKLQSLAALEQKIKNSGALQSDTAGAAAVKKQYAEVQKLIAAYEQLRNAIGNVGGMQFKQGGFGGQLGDLNKNLSLIKQNSADALGGFAREQRAASDSTSNLSARQQILANAIQQANQSAKGQSQILSELRNMASQYVSVWGAVNFVKEVAQVTGELELQRKSLEVIIGSATKAGELYGQIRDMSQMSPYTFQDLTKSTRQLAAFGVQTKDLYGTMKSLSDIGAGLSVDVSRLILAYGHTKSYGYLSGIQNRQFETAGIDMVGALADRYNKLAREAAGANEEIQRVSRKDVFKMIHDKEVSFEDVNAVIMDLDKPGGKFYNMQEKQYDTLGGKLRNLRNNYNIMLSEIGQSTHGVLATGVDALNDITAHWDKYASVLTTVLIPLGLVKTATWALTTQTSAATKAMVTNLRNMQAGINLVGAYKNVLGGGGLWKSLKEGYKANVAPSSLGTMRDWTAQLKKGISDGVLGKQQLIRFGLDKNLDSSLRSIALRLAGIDKSTAGVLAKTKGLALTWQRMKFSVIGLGATIRGLAVTIGGMVASMAPLMLITAAIQKLSKISAHGNEVADNLRTGGANDQNEAERLLKKYDKELGDNLWFERTRRSGAISGFTYKINKVKIKKGAIKESDITAIVDEVKEKLQAMSPLWELDLFDIDSIKDQEKRLVEALNKVEAVHRAKAVQEQTADSIGEDIKDTAGRNGFTRFFNDDIIDNMQDWLDEVNDWTRDFGQLSMEEVGEWNKGMGGFLEFEKERRGLRSMQDALKAIVYEASESENSMKALDAIISRSGKNVSVSSKGYIKLSNALGSIKKQANTMEDNINEMSSKLAGYVQTNFYAGDKTDMDAAAQYIQNNMLEMFGKLKGLSPELRLGLSEMFYDSIVGSLNDMGMRKAADKLRQRFVNQLFAANIEDFLKSENIKTEEIDSRGKAEEVFNQFITYLESQGGRVAVIAHTFGETFKEQFIKGLETREDGAVLEVWKKNLLDQLKKDKILINIRGDVKSDLVADIKGSTDLKKLWEETFKKRYDEAKSYIESQKPLIKTVVDFEMGANFNFGDIKQLQELFKHVEAYQKNFPNTPFTPYVDKLHDFIKTFIEITRLSDLNHQNLAQGSREDWRKKQQEAVNKRKQEQDRAAREAKQKADEARRKAEQAAREAEQKEHERQRKVIDDAKAAVDAIKSARKAYEDAIKDGYSKWGAQQKVIADFKSQIDEGIVKKESLLDLEHYVNALDEIHRQLKETKWPYNFEDIRKSITHLGLDIDKIKIDIRDIGFDEAKDKFLSMCEKQMDDLMRAWSMFEDTVGKTGNYDLAEKFSGKRFGSLMDNGLGMAGNASKSGNLWNMIISKTWSNANKLGSYGGDLPGDLFDRSEIFGLDKKSLEEKVRETFDKILLASPRFRKFQSEKNEGEMRKMREDLYSQVPGFVKMLEQWQKALQDDEDAAKKHAAELLGSSKSIEQQRRMIEKDYEENIRKISVEDEKGNKYIPEESKAAAQMAKDRRDYELLLLSQEYQQYMNAVETLTVDEVRRSAEFIRARLAEAFQKGIIDANTFTEQNKEVTERLNQNLPYNLPLVGNGRKAIYEQVGRWFFDPTSEKNRAALQNWQGDVSRRLDNEQSKKEEEQDENLIAALGLLADLLNRILSGTATQKDRQLAGELGGVIAGWGTVNTSTKDRIIRQAKENKEQHDEDEQNGKASKKIVTFAEAVKWATDALEKLQEGLDYFSGFFKSIGMKGASNALSDASTVVGSTLGGAKTLQGLASSIAPSLGPYGAAAGAALGVISGIAQANDARHQRNIEKLRHDVQKIDNTLNLIRKLRESGLGYDDGSLRRQLAAQAAASGDKVMADYYARGGLSGTGYAQEIQALKKQREDYMSMYDEENAKKDKSREDLEEYKTKVAELDVQIRDYSQNLAKELWSIDIKGWASQIGDALMTAFENGTNAAAAFRDSVQDIMRSVVKSMMIKGILEPAFEKVFDKMFGKNGTFDENNPQTSLRPTLDVLTKFFDEDLPPLVTVAKEFYEGANNIAEQNIGYGLDSKDSSKNLTNSITSTASEETMGIVAGYLSALRQDVGVNRIMLTGFMNESWPSYIEIVTKANNSLTAVDRNTEQIMTMMRDGQGALYERVERMSRRIDNFATGIDRLHTA